MSLDPDCIFCKVIAKKIRSKIVYEDEIAIAFEDASPQAPFHALIVPKKHIPDIHSMTEADRETVGHLFFAARKIAESNDLDTKGYRMVTNNGPGAGQGVFHIHFHLLSGRRFTWPPG